MDLSIDVQNLGLGKGRKRVVVLYNRCMVRPNSFQVCATRVLDGFVRKIVDETISGRDNWAKLNLE